MERHDVIVVGGGAMGSAAAWQLAKRGRDVLLLERFEQGHVRGGSHGASRVFRFAYPDLAYVHFAQASVPLWRELESDSGQTILEQTGGVDHGHPDRMKPIVEALSAAGARFEVLSPDEAHERWAGMRFDRQVVFHPDAGRTNADLTLQTLNDAAVKFGADLHFEEGALSIEPGDDSVLVRTDKELYRAPVAIVAVGSWAPKALEGLVALPPIRVSQEQPAHFQPIDDGSVWPSFLHYKEGPGSMYGLGIYGLETPGEGIKVGEHCTGVEVDPDERDFVIEPSRFDRLKRYVENWFPGLDSESGVPISCLYDISPAEDFVIDRLGSLVVATGFSGHGFKFTPLIGRILADLADSQGGSSPRFRLPNQ